MEATLEKKPKKKSKLKKETLTLPRLEQKVLAGKKDRLQESSIQQTAHVNHASSIEEENVLVSTNISDSGLSKSKDIDVSQSNDETQTNTEKCVIHKKINCDVSKEKKEESKEREKTHTLKYVITEFNHPLRNAEFKTKGVYPDLKCMEKCYHTDNIVGSLLLVNSFRDQHCYKIWREANIEYKEFVKVATGLENHPLTVLIHQYRIAKESHKKIDSAIRDLRSKFKRKKDSLWKSIDKQSYSVGKCDDGTTIKASQKYSVKKLDLEKFEELKHLILKLEESFVSAALHSYLVQLTKLKIEHFISECIRYSEMEMNLSDKEKREEGTQNLKKCVSVLFDSQRQRCTDKSYFSSCQTWLKTLVVNVLLKENVKNNIFLINHIIRCPNGIYNWASELIQIPFADHSKNMQNDIDCSCIQHMLVILFLVLQTAPERDRFLKDVRDLSLEMCDRNFIVLDSEDEDEETFEMSRKWSEDDVISILKQIPLATVYKHMVSNNIANESSHDCKEKLLLKIIAFSSTIVDILLIGLDTFTPENFTRVYDYISNMIRHIALYVSSYWKKYFVNIAIKPEHQAVYDQFLFGIIFKLHKYEKLHVWKILPSFPYKLISRKMLWNILLIFYYPNKSEKDIYSEKDVELKIKDESVNIVFNQNVREFSPISIIYLLKMFEQISLSCNGEDISKFLLHTIFQVAIVDPYFQTSLSNEGLEILTSLTKNCPYLTSLLIKEINVKTESTAEFCLKLFENMDIQEWVPENSDICILSEWLLSNPLSSEFSHLSRLILKKMNWSFKNDTLALPLIFHKKVAVLVAEAYIKFDVSGNEGVLSRGIKQILDFTSIRKVKEEFSNWAWNLLFSLKLNPLDFINPPWIQIYEGFVEDSVADPYILESNAVSLQHLQAVSEVEHPCYSYLLLIMTDTGMSAKTMVEKGLSCFCNLVNSQQYMAAINSLYYILPFFVRKSDLLMEQEEFMASLSYLFTADMSSLSVTSEPVYGVVIKEISALIKHQIGDKLAVEYSVPLLKLWVNILLKLSLSQDKSITSYIKSGKQLYYLLDIISQIAFLDHYERESLKEFLSTFCDPNARTSNKSSTSFWGRFFSNSPSFFPILNKSTIPHFPWLAFFILLAETEEKNVQMLWIRVQEEMLKQNVSAFSALKNVSSSLKISPTYDVLPIYRWALQIIETPVSHPILPLLLQQFFIYYFYQVETPSSQGKRSIGMLYFKNTSYASLFKKLKNHIIQAGIYYKEQFEKTQSPDFQEKNPVPCAPPQDSSEEIPSNECIQPTLMKY